MIELVIGLICGCFLGWFFRLEYVAWKEDMKALQEAEDEAKEQNRGID